jgi:peptidoglycan/LPS O-acetylase OafA/YrhL
VSRTLELTVGLMLLVTGVIVLSSTWIGEWFAENGVDTGLLEWWPMLLILGSLFFLVPILFSRLSRRLRAGMVIPGVMLLLIGIALLYTSLNDRWEEWASLWTVVPFSLGLGMYAAGWLADAPAFKWIGAALAAAGVVAYLALATAFGGEAFRLIGALGIIALGLALTVGGLAQRLARKSPPPSVPPTAPTA